MDTLGVRQIIAVWAVVEFVQFAASRTSRCRPALGLNMALAETAMTLDRLGDVRSCTVGPISQLDRRWWLVDETEYD